MRVRSRARARAREHRTVARAESAQNARAHVTLEERRRATRTGNCNHQWMFIFFNMSLQKGRRLAGGALQSDMQTGICASA